MSECKLPTKPKTREQSEAEAKESIRRGGYKAGGRLRQEDDAAQDRRMVKSAVGQHEAHDHPSKPKTKLKLRGGGKVAGREPEHRADRRARGGATKGKGGHKAPVEVNIVEKGAADGEKRAAAAKGMQVGAKLGAASAMRDAPGMSPKPPAGGPAGAGGNGAPPGAEPPPGMSAGPDQPPMKRGGRAK